MKTTDIERGFADETATFLLREWYDNKGHLTNDMPAYYWASGRILVLGRPSTEYDPAELLIVGTESFAATMMDSNYMTEPQTALSFFTDDYKTLVARSHFYACENIEPVYDLVVSEVDGEQIMYERLILPYIAGDGSILSNCYSMPIGDTQSVHSILNDRYRPAGLPQSRYPSRLDQQAPSSSSSLIHSSR